MPVIATSTSQQASNLPIPLFELSSHYRHWRFSNASLEKARIELNEQAIARVQSKVEEDRVVAAATIGTEQNEVEAANIEYLTVLDEKSLVEFYLVKIAQLSRASVFRFPEIVEATATTFLKRFYLRNTSKTENYMMPISAFASRLPKTSESDVLNLEFVIAQSLRFEFKIHHAHVAARGILVELASGPPAPGSNSTISTGKLGDGKPVGPEALRQAWEAVQITLRSARLTDLEFLYTPSQIALAAWSLAAPALTAQWLHTTSSRAEAVGSKHGEAAPLVPNLEPIKATLEKAQAFVVDKERVTAVDRRLKFCTNPEKDPSSALYKKKAAEEERMAMEKAKNNAHKGVGEDPFGSGHIRVDAKVDDVFT